MPVPVPVPMGPLGPSWGPRKKKNQQFLTLVNTVTDLEAEKQVYNFTFSVPGGGV